jgi:glycosyltransferase involved in cell wall biosynthesis
MALNRIAIDARIPDEGLGGVQQVLLTLMEGFGELPSKEFTRFWIVLEGTSWWQGKIPLSDSLILVKPPFGKMAIHIQKRFPKLVSLAYPVLSKFLKVGNELDNLMQKYEVNMVHFPFQDSFKTKLPFLYQPHDLQHVHYPENFSRAQLLHRNTHWKKTATDASIITVAAAHIAEDLVEYWSIDAKKIQVLPVPPPTRTKVIREDADTNFEPFIVYPSAFWKHKNHESLIKGFKRARDLGTNLSLILPGSHNGQFRSVFRMVEDLALSEFVHFPGHITSEELAQLIVKSNAVIVPSLYEALSLTIWDAYNFGKPILCSNKAIIYGPFESVCVKFDPENYHGIADAILGIDKIPKRSKTSQLDWLPKPKEYAESISGIYSRCLVSRT